MGVWCHFLFLSHSLEVTNRFSSSRLTADMTCPTFAPPLPSLLAVNSGRESPDGALIVSGSSGGLRAPAAEVPRPRSEVHKLHLHVSILFCERCGTPE